MATVDFLMHRDPDPHLPGHLSPDEILRRVASRFPLAVIDRERGNQMVRATADEMVELGLPPTDTLAVNYRELEGRVAYVTVRERESGPQFGFFLLPHPTLINIDYERPEERTACRPLLEQLAAELAEYDIKTEDLVD